jgi:hypothetical protein
MKNLKLKVKLFLYSIYTYFFPKITIVQFEKSNKEGSDSDSDKCNKREIQRRVYFERRKQKRAEAKRLKIEQQRNFIHAKIRRELNQGFPNQCVIYDKELSNETRSVYRCYIYHHLFNKRRNSV